MDDLIARLESAEEGSRELDAWVAATIGQPGWKISEVDGLPLRCGPGFAELVHYTTSIDWALTLVPLGWWLSMRRPKNREDARAFALLETNERPYHASGTAPTIALALCIAALKARNAEHQP